MDRRLLLALFVLSSLPLVARADIFVLANQGEIRGDLRNRTESPRRTYQIDVAGGGQITLDKEQVLEVRRESPAQLEYERRRAAASDTVADHWALAEYCRQNLMLANREQHLRRILELDPEHEAAHRGLGHIRVDGGWSTQEEVMSQRGYVRYKGRWMLPQEVELEEAGRKARLEEVEWFTNIRRWRGWLEGERAPKALEQIREIKDPTAVKAIKGQLHDEKNPRLRKMWLETLGRIDSPAARSVLVDISLNDGDVEMRLSAVDELAKSKDHDVVVQYVKALKNKENVIINRAAVGLAAMEDKSSVHPLIDVLVTTHQKTVQEGNGQIGAAFPTNGSGGPGGLSVGSRTVTIKQTFQNEDVRNALVRITGINFQFDIDRWKAWHAAQKQDEAINVRRDQ